MKSTIKILITSYLILYTSYLTIAQVAINQDNSQPNASALLDVKSTDKGVLIPRMTTTQRTAISSPATGLMVFDNTTKSFWFYSGTVWTEIKAGNTIALQDGDGDTKIQVEKIADEDKIRFDLGGSERVVIEQNPSGATLFNLPNNSQNTFLGQNAGIANTSGVQNNFLGYQAGYANTDGLRNNFIGYQAGYNNTNGNNNIFTGYKAGYSNILGNGNIFLGYQAGYSETGSNKLYIENSNSATPLIYGDFGNDIVKIHGTLGIKNEYTFPIIKGTTGQVLQTDGAGSTTWTTPSTQTLIADSDNDTKIQVEESADEDSIRIDIGGSERMVIKQSSTGATLLNLPNNNFNTFLGQDAGRLTTQSGFVNGRYNNFIGYQAGYSNAGGFWNVFNGCQAGYSNTIGFGNVFNGYRAGYSNSSGNLNVFTGFFAGHLNSTGSDNVFIGPYAGYVNSTGEDNVYIGSSSGLKNAVGSFNVFIGYQTGYNNQYGSRSVFIGYQAGYNEADSNKLYIENSNSSTPLIYGEFDNDIVKIHGTLGIKNVYTFPIVDGTAGQVLQTDGAGSTAWATPIPNTDNQKIDTIQLDGTHLKLSLENDGEALKSIDLSSINATKTLITDSDNDTKIQVEEGPDEDKVRIDLGGSERMVIEQSSVGGTLIQLPNNDKNTFLGQNAGRLTKKSTVLSITLGERNNFIGYEAGYSNNEGKKNVFNGYQTGYSNTDGHSNVFTGHQAGHSNTSGDGNLFNGSDAGYSNTTGDDNTFSGHHAGYDNTMGNENVFVGNHAGYVNKTGNANVFIGFQAGFYEKSSNKLYIENSNSTTPLIYGDFANDTVKIYGTLGIKNVYTFPIVDGTTGQVLQTDGTGNTAWVTPTPNTDAQTLSLSSNTLSLANGGSVDLSSYVNTDAQTLSLSNDTLSLVNGGSIDLRSFANSMKDADGDTKIQVEATTDEDSIRIDISGSERMVIRQSTTGATLLNLPNNNFNTFLGQDAGRLTTQSNNVDGRYNNFIGYQAGNANTTGGGNVFNGYQSGYKNLGGYQNVFNGYQSGYNNVGGIQNVFIGQQAGYTNIAGNGNLFLGHHAGYHETGSNKLYIENSNSTTPLIYGEFDNNLVKINGDLHYTGTLTDLSDRRLKENLRPITNTIEKLQQLKGYTYNLITDADDNREYGLMAQDVQKVFPEMVKIADKETGYLGVSYIQLVPVLLEATKEQQTQIQNLEKENAQYKTQLQTVLQRLEALEQQK